MDTAATLAQLSEAASLMTDAKLARRRSLCEQSQPLIEGLSLAIATKFDNDAYLREKLSQLNSGLKSLAGLTKDGNYPPGQNYQDVLSAIMNLTEGMVDGRSV